MDAPAIKRAERHGEIFGQCLVLIFWTLSSSLPLLFVYFTAKYGWLRRAIAYPIQLSIVGIGIWAGVKTYKFVLHSQEADEESGTDRKRKNLLSELILLIPAVLVAIAAMAFLRLLVSHRMVSAFDWNWNTGTYWQE
jgi:hypothetical protein